MSLYRYELRLITDNAGPCPGGFSDSWIELRAVLRRHVRLDGDLFKWGVIVDRETGQSHKVEIRR